MRSEVRRYLDADWRRLCALAGQADRPRRWASSFGPRFAHVCALRWAQVLYARGYTRLAKIPSLFNFLVFSLEVPARLTIGPGLVMPHPQGIVMGARAIGANATIFHQVTFGGRVADFEYLPASRPVVGDGVTVSAGAKILGPVSLGDGSTIGANAVVLIDVPPGATAVGVPARIIEAAHDGAHE